MSSVGNEAREPDPSTVAAILLHLRDALEQQLTASDAADSKALQLASAGSVVIGFAVVGSRLGATHVRHHWLLVLALVAYLGTMAAAFTAVRVRRFAVARNADDIWATHWDSTVTEFEWATIHQISKGYAKNRGLLNEKARAVQVALVLLAAEVALIGFDLLWR